MIAPLAPDTVALDMVRDDARNAHDAFLQHVRQTDSTCCDGRFCAEATDLLWHADEADRRLVLARESERLRARARR